ncbi:MAG: MoaD/ThiS family protein [Desulfobacterales bacterium]|nr:MoaD/ThiS family protein [Desulfobacterales bacterium]MDX2510541.1 MoaD/ThiS family protein [Desulfobacterales bacterium]
MLDGEKVPWQSGMTVSQLLQEIADAHQYAVIRVNGKYVSRPSFDRFVIPDNAEIYLIPMIAGG